MTFDILFQLRDGEWPFGLLTLLCIFSSFIYTLLEWIPNRNNKDVNDYVFYTEVTMNIS